MDINGDCWFGEINTKMNTSGNQVALQICPLQIQLGIILVISTEPSLQSPEINLMKALLSSQFRSGPAKFLTDDWSKAYSHHFEPPFSGKYCEELDAWSYK
ncbi:Protein eyes shut, partial [Galemys pyrenaicus]